MGRFLGLSGEKVLSFLMRVLNATEIGRFLGITVKSLVPCRCLDGHVIEEPYEMSMA